MSGLSSGNTYTYYVRCSSSGAADTSDYQVSFSVASAPTVSSGITLSPSSGSGSSQTFVEQVIDANGAASLTQVDLIVGQIGATNSCWVEYGPSSRTMYLQDDNNNWMSAALGSSTVLQNSQCSINAGASSVSTSGGGTQLTVNFAMSFTSKYSGAQPLVTSAADSTGWYTGFVNSGTYTVSVPQPVAQGLTLSLSPASGSGVTANFVLTATDGAGYAAVQQIALFVGNNLGGTNQCYIDYEASSRTIYLLSANNSTWMPAVLGSGAVLSNGLCALHSSSVVVSGSGSTLTLTVPVSFSTKQYGGTHQVMTFGADSQGHSTGWQTSGTWKN
jgi:hypothetical protein